MHGDVPLEPTAGGLLADLIVDRTLSCILDLSQFESDADKARFALAFADRFFFRKKAMPSAVHLFLEKLKSSVPQNPQKGEERMLHAFTRLQKLGTQLRHRLVVHLTATARGEQKGAQHGADALCVSHDGDARTKGYERLDSGQGARPGHRGRLAENTNWPLPRVES